MLPYFANWMIYKGRKLCPLISLHINQFIVKHPIKQFHVRLSRDYLHTCTHTWIWVFPLIMHHH